MIRSSRIHWWLIFGSTLFLAVLLAACNGDGLPSASPATPTPNANATVEALITPFPTATILPLTERKSIFNKVWNTVNENYLYPDFNGADWKALRSKYEPLAESAKSSDEFYSVMSDMVLELKDDHSRFVPPAKEQEETELRKGAADFVGVGISVETKDKSIFVAFVFPNSPAEKAGLKRRDLITAIDGKPFVDVDKEEDNIRGPAGTTVNLTVDSPEQPERVVPIVRGHISGSITATSSFLKADPSIGYLLVPTFWVDDMDQQVETKLNGMLDNPAGLKGLVIDLRFNSGGSLKVEREILGDFTSGKVGSYFDQKSSSPITINANPIAAKLTNVPVVVLVDKGSESASEQFSASMQELGRAKVVGIPSAGNTETVNSVQLEDGSVLWCATDGFKLNDGTNLEGRGVIPDVTVDQDWTRFTDDDDPQILKAVDILHTSQATPTP